MARPTKLRPLLDLLPCYARCYIFASRYTGQKIEMGERLDQQQRLERIRLFERVCRDRGERCTAQRRIILEAVLELDNHPTADQVYEAVKPRLPEIARTTVYRVLEHLARLGVITKACHPGRVARYDTRIESHHHLVCLRCNEFIDFDHEDLEELALPDTSALGFEASDYRVQIRGICRNCMEAMKREELK